ncbi:thioredoxin family protein [Salinactinospora qingdaonensis]|uniref:Thioredoxin domain-containing protein n=1 Tax=Salinactinospora qingdaonensis TaxID=702744 RepID=A0ABP7G2T9_9ACTN
MSTTLFRKPRPRPGEPAPALALPATDGTTVTAAKGEITVVVFTCNHCPFALAWHDRLCAVARDYAPHGVRLIHVNANDSDRHPDDSFEAMAARVERGEFPGPYLWDEHQRAARAWGVMATPEVFVVDAEGVLRYHGAPDADHDDPAQEAAYLRGALDDLLAGNPVSTAETEVRGCSLKWRVELLYWSGCPSHPDALALAEDVLTEIGKAGVGVRSREIRTLEEAEAEGFVGSPTLRVGGAELIEPEPGTPAALACRLYRRRDGRSSPLPDRDDLAEALRAALVYPWELPGWQGRP